MTDLRVATQNNKDIAKANADTADSLAIMLDVMNGKRRESNHFNPATASTK